MPLRVQGAVNHIPHLEPNPEWIEVEGGGEDFAEEITPKLSQEGDAELTWARE